MSILQDRDKILSLVDVLMVCRADLPYCLLYSFWMYT